MPAAFAQLNCDEYACNWNKCLFSKLFGNAQSGPNFVFYALFPPVSSAVVQAGTGSSLDQTSFPVSRSPNQDDPAGLERVILLLQNQVEHDLQNLISTTRWPFVTKGLK